MWQPNGRFAIHPSFVVEQLLGLSPAAAWYLQLVPEDWEDDGDLDSLGYRPVALYETDELSRRWQRLSFYGI